MKDSYEYRTARVKSSSQDNRIFEKGSWREVEGDERDRKRETTSERDKETEKTERDK